MIHIHRLRYSSKRTNVFRVQKIQLLWSNNLDHLNNGHTLLQAESECPLTGQCLKVLREKITERKLQRATERGGGKDQHSPCRLFPTVCLKQAAFFWYGASGGWPELLLHNFYKHSVRKQEETDTKYDLQRDFFSPALPHLHMSANGTMWASFAWHSLAEILKNTHATLLDRRKHEEREEYYVKMKSQWRHTKSCLGYCLRKDTLVLWGGPSPNKGLNLYSTSALDDFSDALAMVHAKQYLWICLLPHFPSELHDMSCYLWTLWDKNATDSQSLMMTEILFITTVG